jgi:acyl-coenzyme A synthetase/AMP-(fatty) acid ligase
VVGVPDADGLTKTKAFVVLKAGATVTEADLKAFVKDHLAPYKYPRFRSSSCSELPKTATGKIQRPGGQPLREEIETFGRIPSVGWSWIATFI